MLPKSYISESFSEMRDFWCIRGSLCFLTIATLCFAIVTGNYRDLLLNYIGKHQKSHRNVSFW